MKTNIKTLAAALAAIISVGVLTSCSANTAQTNPEPSETTIAATSQTTPETTEKPQTTSAKETTPSSTKPETQTDKADTTEKTTAPTSAAPSTAAPATTAASTTYTAPATTAAVSTTKPAPASTPAPAPEWTESVVSGTMYVQVAGIYSRSKAVLGAPTVKQYSLNDAVSVTAVTNTGYYKLSDGSFIHADYLGTDKVAAQTASTTKPSTSSAAPTVSKPAATTKATTTTKKQNTSPKPAATTKRQGVTPTVDKTPVQEPTEEEIWDKMSAAEKHEYFDHMAERIAYYLGVHRGNTEIILLPGLSNYAYERTLQNDKVMHDPDNCNALAAELKYGIYYQKGEWGGLKKGWNMPSAAEGTTGTFGYNGFVGFSDKEIDKVAEQVVQDFSESEGHWRSLGDANRKYVGVGYSNKGICIWASDENCDVVNEKLLECNGDVDLFWEKYDAGEFEIY